MLERFKVPVEDQVRVPEDSLRRTVTTLFERMGETPEDSATAADVLVTADLRGVETHGVSNMMRAYIAHYKDDVLKARAEWRVVRETAGTATVDADSGLALILGPKAMQMAVDKAKQVGVGIVAMRNAGHSGAIGHHAMLAAEQDMVGMVMTAGGLHVVPTFGAEKRLGTNPIAIAAPARHEAPLLFDAATSAIAGNKFRLAQRVDAKVLPGWIADTDGNPVMEESPFPEVAQLSILPTGGTRELGSHKGYGFGLMPEVLATLLSGALPNMLTGLPLVAKHYFAAYDIAAFTDVDQFKDNMDLMLRKLRTTKPAPGHERVLYPGLPEHEEEQDRRANGIPLHREVVDWFDDTTSEFGIPSLVRL